MKDAKRDAAGELLPVERIIGLVESHNGPSVARFIQRGATQDATCSASSATGPSTT